MMYNKFISFTSEGDIYNKSPQRFIMFGGCFMQLPFLFVYFLREKKELLTNLMIQNKRKIMKAALTGNVFHKPLA